jgi:hypothetical protein
VEDAWSWAPGRAAEHAPAPGEGTDEGRPVQADQRPQRLPAPLQPGRCRAGLAMVRMTTSFTPPGSCWLC